MISILHKLTKRDISGKYLKYAAGEIFLIVVGILIAINLNNWVEQQKNSRYELLILSEIHQSMKNDMRLIETYFLPRLKMGESALTQLLEMTGKALPISEAELTRLIEELRYGDFLFTFTSGPYESLKNNGLDKLSNKELRVKIIDFYGTFLPRFAQFIHDGDDYQLERLEQLSNELFSRVVVEDSAGKWKIRPKLAVENPLSHPAFLETLNIQVGRSFNDKSRLTEIIRRYKNLMSEIEVELSR